MLTGVLLLSDEFAYNMRKARHVQHMVLVARPQFVQVLSGEYLWQKRAKTAKKMCFRMSS